MNVLFSGPDVKEREEAAQQRTCDDVGLMFSQLVNTLDLNKSTNCCFGDVGRLVWTG